MNIRLAFLTPSLLALSAAAVIGCAFLNERPAAAQLTIQYATLKYIGDDQAKKDRVIEIAEAAKQLSSTSATLAALEEAIRARIDWNSLDPADRLLADGLVNLVHAELAARFQQDVLDPEQVVALNQVLDWIIAAASL